LFTWPCHGHGSLALAGGDDEIVRGVATYRHDATRDQGTHREHPGEAACCEQNDAACATAEGRQ
jgi:hypothetical protein